MVELEHLQDFGGGSGGGGGRKEGEGLGGVSKAWEVEERGGVNV